MVAQVIYSIFSVGRGQLFRHWCPDKKEFIKPLHGRASIDPPLWMLWFFTQQLVGDEFNFICTVVAKLCRGTKTQFDFEEKANKRRRRAGSSTGTTAGRTLEQDLNISRTMTKEDRTALTWRCALIVHFKKHIGKELTLLRNQSRRVLFKKFFFIVKKIQDIKANNIEPATRGYHIRWNRPPKPANSPHARPLPGDQFEDYANWNIPIALQVPPKGDEKSNDDRYKEMMLAFPSMNCSAHYRVEPRAPSTVNRNAFARYSKDIKNHPQGLYLDKKIEINFHNLAVQCLEHLHHDPNIDALPTILALSRHSLRAIHILACGLRGAVAAVTKPLAAPSRVRSAGQTDAENAARHAVSARTELDDNDYARASLMLGALSSMATGGSDEADDKDKGRSKLEESLTSISYKAFCQQRKNLGPQLHKSAQNRNSTPATDIHPPAANATSTVSPPTDRRTSPNGSTQESDSGSPHNRHMHQPAHVRDYLLG